MKLNNFVVNVGDLLHKQGSKDIIAIPDLFIDEKINKLNGSIELTSVSDDELYVTIKGLTYELNTLCDYCGKDKVFSKSLPDENYSFMMEALITPELKEEESIFPISSERSIDVYALIRDTIWLADDVQHVCQECKLRLDSAKPESESALDEDEHISGNIVFT